MPTALLDAPANRRAMKYRPPTSITELPPDKAFGPLEAAALLQAPPVLYAAGDTALLQAVRRVAVVGTREPTDEGRRRAAKLSRQLAEANVVVVSGLAMGIDGAAHRAAIEGGGRTIAVLGTPLDKATPSENAELQETIYRDHLLVSQFVNGSLVRKTNFLARNRTMAMLSHASVIIEAGETSGTLHQARETMRLGHRLFIMKSTVENPKLTWPAEFLKSGAVVLTDVAQVLEVLPP